jgi:phosphoribosylformimino-5-aminoimidazole carboxamide ribotide isomerase
MLVIPAIDIYENSIVRLKKGDFESITYYKNTPLQQAKLYDALGFETVHIVDLVGSKTGKLTALESIEKIKAETKLKIEFGGGIRDEKTVSELFSAGIDFVIIGSLSVKNRAEFELILTPLKKL